MPGRSGCGTARGETTISPTPSRNSRGTSPAMRTTIETRGWAVLRSRLPHSEHATAVRGFGWRCGHNRKSYDREQRLQNNGWPAVSRPQLVQYFIAPPI
jgi:hypothetical protein